MAKKTLIAVLLLILPRVAFALTFDKYGGINQLSCPNGAQAHFYTQRIGLQWWLCDPLGHSYTLIGAVQVNFNVNPNQQTNITSKYNSVSNANWSDAASRWYPNWVKIEEARLSAWNFTDASDGSYNGIWPTAVDVRWTTSDHTPAYKMPFNIGAHLSSYAMQNTQGCGASSPIKDVMGAEGATYTGTLYNNPDFFDPGFSACATNILNTTNNPNGLYQAQGTASGFTTTYADYFLYATVDEGDQTGFLGAGPDFSTLGNDGTPNVVQVSPHAAWVVLSSSPAIAKAPVRGFADQTYSNQENYSKVNLANTFATEYLCTAASTPLTCCTGNKTGTCSVDPNAGAGTAITGANMTTAKNALNTAWGSSFTTLSTSDSSCSANLATCLGSGGSVTYNSWAAANCKGNGEPLACCTAAGVGATCGTKGTGLLDEDGSDQILGDACTLKTSATAQSCLTGRTTNETASMQADMNTWLGNYVVQYFGTVVPIMQTDAPGILIQMLVGGFGAPSRAIVLQKACQYLTLPQMAIGPTYSQTNDWQARYDFIADNCGNHAWMYWFGAFANPDSSESSHTRTDNLSSTQAGRGTAYGTLAGLMATTIGTHDSVYHGVGWYWWQFEDSDSEGLDWGLTTNQHDNAYDGVESVTGSPACDQGTGSSSFTCGGEAANYGNFIGPVSTANLAAMQSMVNQTSAGGTGSGNGGRPGMW